MSVVVVVFVDISMAVDDAITVVVSKVIVIDAVVVTMVVAI